MLFRYGRHRVLRGIGVLYPLVTALVVMGTANHYLMDACAGVAVMGIGFLLAKPALRLTDAVRSRVLPTAPAEQSLAPTTPAPAPTAAPAPAPTASEPPAPPAPPAIPAPAPPTDGEPATHP
jgi:hypothetical protein